MRSLYALALSLSLVAITSPIASAAPAGVHAGHDHAAGDHAAHDHSAHDHDAPGPHGGALFVLGNESYHAELVLDEKMNQVTVVLLDNSAKKQVAIEEPHLLVNVRGGGNPRQYKLSPLYAEGTTSGPTAMYAAVNKPLMDDLHSHSAVAKLAVRIAGKPYSTSLHHDDDHSGHDHAGHKH